MSQRMAVDKPQAERSVIINGNVMLYNVKAPYTESGKSILGALEFDPDDDTVRCHECGLWFKGLARHIGAVHGLSGRDYKLKHGLKLQSGLVAESTRAKLIKQTTDAMSHAARRKTSLCNANNRKKALAARKKAKLSIRAGKKLGIPAYENLHRLCAKQLVEKIKTVQLSMQKTPTTRELEEHGVSRSAVMFHFGSHAKALYAAGMEDGVVARAPRYTDEQLLEFLRNVVLMKNRLPTRSDNRRGLIPSQYTYNRRFGSWSNAIQAAGYVAPKKWAKWNVPVPIAGAA
jgi:predicted transcriptional regulator